MKARRRHTVPTEDIHIRGFVRLALRNTKTGEVTIREIHNAILADGFQNYIVGSIGGLAGSKVVTHLQLATQTSAPATSQSIASGEFEARKSTLNAFIPPGTLRVVCAYGTNEALASAMGAVALYNVSAAGSACSIATFATSQKTTDQTLNITYELRFS